MTSVDPSPELEEAESSPKALERIRASPRNRAIALAVAVPVGVSAAWVHWVGLLLAGALVGLVSRDLPRAMIAALGVGVLVLFVFALSLSLGEALRPTLAMTPAVYVTVGAAIGLPLLGSLVRGIR